jgi:bacterioferritin
MRKQSLDFLVQRVQKIDLRSEQEEIIKHYRERRRRRILQVECAGEFAPSAKLRDIIIIAQEQDHEIDLKDTVGLR